MIRIMETRITGIEMRQNATFIGEENIKNETNSDPCLKEEGLDDVGITSNSDCLFRAGYGRAVLGMVKYSSRHFTVV